jgi:hypothetical protein
MPLAHYSLQMRQKFRRLANEPRKPHASNKWHFPLEIKATMSKRLLKPVCKTQLRPSKNYNEITSIKNSGTRFNNVYRYKGIRAA